MLDAGKSSPSHHSDFTPGLLKKKKERKKKKKNTIPRRIGIKNCSPQSSR
jgi:hypothetical protein